MSVSVSVSRSLAGPVRSFAAACRAAGGVPLSSSAALAVASSALPLGVLRVVARFGAGRPWVAVAFPSSAASSAAWRVGRPCLASSLFLGRCAGLPGVVVVFWFG